MLSWLRLRDVAITYRYNKEYSGVSWYYRWNDTDVHTVGVPQIHRCTYSDYRPEKVASMSIMSTFLFFFWMNGHQNDAFLCLTVPRKRPRKVNGYRADYAPLRCDCKHTQTPRGGLARGVSSPHERVTQNHQWYHGSDMSGIIWSENIDII